MTAVDHNAFLAAAVFAEFGRQAISVAETFIGLASVVVIAKMIGQTVFVNPAFAVNTGIIGAMLFIAAICICLATQLAETVDANPSAVALAVVTATGGRFAFTIDTSGICGAIRFGLAGDIRRTAAATGRHYHQDRQTQYPLQA